MPNCNYYAGMETMSLSFRHLLRYHESLRCYSQNGGSYLHPSRQMLDSMHQWSEIDDRVRVDQALPSLCLATFWPWADPSLWGSFRRDASTQNCALGASQQHIGADFENVEVSHLRGVIRLPHVCRRLDQRRFEFGPTLFHHPSAPHGLFVPCRRNEDPPRTKSIARAYLARRIRP